MKLAYHLVLSLGFTFGLAFAEVANEPDYSNVQWAHGVSVNEETGKVEGWYDAEKTREKDIDDMLCYAASASNLLAWWQNSSYAVASEAPTELDAIWGAYKENNLDAAHGGFTLGALNWWLSGVYSPAKKVENPDDDSSAWVWDSDSPLWDRYYMPQSGMEDVFGQDTVVPVTLPNLKKGDADFRGYYYDQYGLTQEKLSDFLTLAWIYSGPITPDDPEEDDVASGTTHHTMTLGDLEIAEDEGPESIYDIDFVTILENSAISISIHSDGPVDAEGNRLAHSITLWGVEYENGVLSKLWLTDSDDYTEQLFSVSVTLDEKENKIYLGTLITESAEKEGETETDSYYYVKEYGKNVFIGVVYALDTAEIANWQLVPEPATATLSLLALAALASRRRRTCNAECRIQNAE